MPRVKALLDNQSFCKNIIQKLPFMSSFFCYIYLQTKEYMYRFKFPYLKHIKTYLKKNKTTHRNLLYLCRIKKTKTVFIKLTEQQ